MNSILGLVFVLYQWRRDRFVFRHAKGKPILHSRLELLGGVSATAFGEHYEELINERIAKDEPEWEAQWTEAIALGSERFVREMADRIGGRQQLVIEGAGDSWTLKEPAIPYIAFSRPETKCKGLHYR